MYRLIFVNIYFYKYIYYNKKILIIRSYKNILNLFPFIGKDFYYYSHPDCDLFRLRSFNDKQIFCDLKCATISSGLSLNTSICNITFKKKTDLFSKQRTYYENIYELSFYKHFIIKIQNW